MFGDLFRRVRLLATVPVLLASAFHVGDPTTGSPTGGDRIEVADPLGRSAAGVTYDIDRDQLVVFGGFAGFGDQFDYLRDTWAWDSSGWHRHDLPVSPPKGYGFAMAYDQARHNTVVFGGSDDRSTFDQTWIWDGATWTEKHPASSPPAAFGSVAVWDHSLGKVVMLLGDLYTRETTWSWDGQNWKREPPGLGPPARVFAAGAFDDSNSTFLVFGGSWSCGDYPCSRGDTWTWDGTQWIRQGPGSSPEDRIGPAAAYDPNQGVIVLFGGSYSEPYRDTWTWNGVTWTQQHPSTSPSGRSEASMVFDDALGTVLLFGGGTFAHDQNHSFNEIWSWDGSNWTRIA